MTTLHRFSAKVSIVLVLVAASAWTGLDAIRYHNILDGRFVSPWYSAHWYAQPYTHLRLALRPSKEYWTLNATGSERWLVRDTAIGDKVFWTILKRESLS